MRHLIGKDILRFHCVIWPALLLAAGYEVPRQLFVHGYLLIDDRKISKSLGNVIDPLDLVDDLRGRPGAVLPLRSVSFGQDGSVSIDGLHERYERELGNELGNLLSRTTAMIARYRGGRVAPGRAERGARRSRSTACARELVERFDAFDLTGALEAIWERRARAQPLRRGDGAVAAREGRGATRRARPCSTTSPTVCARSRSRWRRTCRETAPRILGALGQPDDLSLERVAYGMTAATDGIEPAPPLFPRVESPTAAA